jgi:hypothetical protein
MKKTSMDVLFTWQKPGVPSKPLGYEWKRQGRWERRQCLMPPKGANIKWTEYVPHTGLFRTFSSLNTATEKAREWEIRDFARDYGDIIARPQNKHATMETWCRAIQHMRRAVELRDRISAPGQHEDLKQLFTRPKGHILYWQMHHPLEKKSDDTTCEAIATGKSVAAYPVGDVIPLARKALQYEIQSSFTDTETPSHTTPSLVTPEMRLVLRPVNLLAHMWLCFARVVSGEIEERPCEMFKSCHEYIYVGHGHGLKRNDSTTCSDACRQNKKRLEARKSAH